jgi:hypothetical protein
MKAHTGTYNIWYHKVSGDWDFSQRDKRSNAVEARCNIKRDAGRTRGDSMPGAYICIFFSRGACYLGEECTFLHRRPTDEDENRVDLMHDVFGRERHKTDRDDMGGVGSFNRDNRTLYVGGLKTNAGVNLEEQIIKHFAEWGDLEYVRVIHAKGIAFVRYRLRAAAEFAKEAMGDSSLGHDETLNIRWANEDPNPATRNTQEKEKQEKGADAILAKWGTTALWQLTMPNPLAYPQTDQQYSLPSYPSPGREDQQQEGEEEGPYDPSKYAPYDPSLEAAQQPEQQYIDPAYYAYYGYPYPPAYPPFAFADPSAYPAPPSEYPPAPEAPTASSSAAPESSPAPASAPADDEGEEAKEEKVKSEAPSRKRAEPEPSAASVPASSPPAVDTKSIAAMLNKRIRAETSEAAGGEASAPEGSSAE